MRSSILIICLLFIYGHAHSQISGKVSGIEDGKEIPLPGASIYWQGSQVGTVTDKNGNYSIEKPNGATRLVASFVGYESQTKIIISKKGVTNFVLKVSGSELNEVDVVGRVDATAVDLKRADLTYKIDDKELRKAACCNLSESFETNATVDVSFTDAITGTKHIEMLGLAGRYALIQRENIPFARGLNASTGFTFIPGPFVESIQLTKGLSSVINGYESLTGQINVELLKPENAPKMLLNLFANQGGRMEGNVVSAFKVSDQTSSEILAHYSNSPFTNDNNQDGFADMPTGSQINLTNKWHFGQDGKGWEGQLAFTAIRDLRNGGQVSFIEESNPADSLWGYESEGNRYELFGKTGYVFEGDPDRSVGFIFSSSYQDRSARFGTRNYFGEQKSLYFNSIFQDELGSDSHSYRTGISFQFDDISEALDNNQLNSSIYNLGRQELVPGAYFEYTYQQDERLTLVGGIRADYNSYFSKAYITPRLNLKYSFNENSTVRIGGGRGQRTPNMILEHLHALASNRVLDLEEAQIPEAEIGWNTGISLSQNIPIKNKLIKFNIDAFYTWFENKLVVDSDFDPRTHFFLYQQGSNSLSLFAQADYEIINNLELRLAYKYLSAQEQFIVGLNQNYLIPKNRAFANIAYGTESNWKFDLTLNWYGEKRLPSTENHPIAIQLADESEDFFTVNLQINKEFKNGVEFFIGCDNLLDYRQNQDPILNAADPSSIYFDTNYTWGPVFGRNIYVGMYYTLN